MRICLLVATRPTADPADLRGRIIAGLADRADVTLAVAGADAQTTGPPAGMAFVTPTELAGNGHWDVAMALDWQATEHLLAVPAGRHVLWLDEFADERLDRWQVERIPAALVYSLPIDYIAADATLAQGLLARRPAARVVAVAPGLDSVTAAPRERATDPINVLIDDRWAPDATSGPGQALNLTGATVEVLTQADDVTARSARFRAADVVLFLDQRAPPLPVLEAMAHGVVPIVAVSGYEEGFLRDGVNAVVVLAEDDRGIQQAIDALASDPARLSALSDGAYRTASSWSSWETQSDALLSVLAEFVADAPPPQATWPATLMADAAGAAVIFREEYFGLSRHVKRIEQDPTVVLALRIRERLEDLGIVRLLRRLRRVMSLVGARFS